MNKLLKIIRNENGQVIVLAALLMVVLMGFAALAIDVGMVAFTKGKLQNAADAAALAGAHELPNEGKAKTEAIKYAELNGVEKINTTATTPYKYDTNKEDPNRIEVVCTKIVQYSFARVLGFDNVEISARAVALKGGTVGGPAFDHAIFSGNPNYVLNLSGNSEITGSVHSNYKINMSGNSDVNGSVKCVSDFTMSGNTKITGTCQAAKITRSGNTSIGKTVESPAPVIAMAEDFSDLIKSAADAAGIMQNGNMTISGNKTINTPIYIKGDLRISGNSTLDFTSPIYVDGDITISGNFTYPGSCIFATGNIVMSGNNNAPNSKVLIYSKNGNITISGNAQPNGVVFAPKGNISISGNAIHGRVIGDTVTLNGNYSVTSGADDLDVLPGGNGSVKLVE